MNSENCDHEPVLVLLCPRCGERLTLHQPDLELSDRFLAICETCKSWYVASDRGDDLVLVIDAET